MKGNNIPDAPRWGYDKIAFRESLPDNHLMIKSLEIENFRSYRKIALRGLGRINVIVGESASGKTSLLESIYFSLGLPVLAFKMRGWRGLGVTFKVNEASPDSLSAPWRDLFFQFDLGRDISVSIQGQGSDQFTRQIVMKHNPKPDIVITSKDKTAEPKTIAPLLFNWYKQGKKTDSAQASYEDGNIVMSGGPTPLPGAFFSNITLSNSEEAGIGFSDLRKARKHEAIIDRIRLIFPFIKDLSTETLNGVSIVHADIPSLPEMAPIGLVSSGVNKLILLLIGITNHKGGVILIDEIENGIYYKLMSQTWQALYDFSVEHKVQLFVTSHSLEAIRKLYPIMENKEQDFRLIRTHWEDGESTAEVFAGANFKSALEQGIDVR